MDIDVQVRPADQKVIYKIETIFVMDDSPFRKQRKALLKKMKESAKN